MTTKTIPAFGYAIVRYVPAGKSEGGIDLPESAEASEARVFMVRASAGHVQDTHLVPCTIEPGQRVWIALMRHKVQDPVMKGKQMEVLAPNWQQIGRGLQDDERLIMLRDVIAWEAAERVLQ